MSPPSNDDKVPTAVNNPLDSAAAEQKASQVVSLIQECVQILRSVEEFAPGASIPLDTVDLYARFDNLLPKIRQLCDGTDKREPTEPKVGMVHNILWPLLASLGECYAVLDQVPPSPPPPTKSKKPPPPPGLLSIQNYTDIAVFIEFLVCTSILPLLQRDVLLSAQDRARHCLPKSLAGRIPRASLLWGDAVQNAKSEMNVSDTILELRTTVLTIGQVVTLDRFRPMLLPRHVVDLYAAMFQADALEKQWKQTTVDVVPLQYEKVSRLLQSSAGTTLVVDPFTQARAYQTLLARGTKAPLWLRQRVSTLLTELACRDIAAIVHIFVRSAGDNMTSASLRLARALTSVPTESEVKYFTDLCRQLVTLLDMPGNQSVSDPLDQSHQAGAMTVCAVLDQLSTELTMEYFFPLITRDLVLTVTTKDTTKSVHKAVRRIGVLVSSVAPSSNPWKLSRLLLSPILDCAPCKHAAKVTIFGQLLRIAAIESIVISSVKDETLLALQRAVQCLVQSSFPRGTQGSGTEIASLALVYSLAPTGLDAQGYRYEIRSGFGSETDRLQAVVLEQRTANTFLDFPSLANDMEKMAKIVVESVLLPFTSNANETEANEAGNDSAQKEISLLSSALFHLLLLCYSSSVASGPRSERKNAHVGLPRIFKDIRVHVKLAVMTLLPLICEKCSPEALLLANDSGAGILTMMKLILNWTRSMYGDIDESVLELSAQQVTKKDDDDEPFHQSSSLLFETLSLGNDNRDTTEDAFDLPVDENWISLSSIVLTLLVTILELGSGKRSDEEEEVLISMLPALGTIARFRDRDPREYKESILFQPEMAEMAAHAMALIAARSQMPTLQSNDEAHEHPKRENLLLSIGEARKDLQSEQPPIRARGVALLTRISHGYLQEKEERLREKPLIAVIDESDQVHGSDEEKESLSLVLAEIVHVSVIALGDTESYVFLAAIQSIVAAADVSPREVIPIIARGICSGIISLSGIGGDEESRTVEVLVSPEQRIKLAEALLFTIRRRGKAIYEFVPLLMNFFLFGTLESADDDLPSGLDAQIQETTHRYFVQGSDALRNDDESVDRSISDQMDLRVRTGGPVFQAEENDILRAACISVLSELVSSAYPSVVTRYCHTLIHFATNSLNLEASRPVRRATALLCYALYGSLLREQDEETFRGRDDSLDRLSLSMGIAMVTSDEEAMHVALRRCANVTDLEASTTQPLTSSERRLYDPATAERCKEALSARAEAERRGVFAAADLFVTSNRHEHSNRVTDLVRAWLNERWRRDNGNVLRLKVDPDNLGLE